MDKPGLPPKQEIDLVHELKQIHTYKLRSPGEKGYEDQHNGEMPTDFCFPFSISLHSGIIMLFWAKT